MDILVTEPFTIMWSPICFLLNLRKKQDGAYWIFLPFCPTGRAPQLPTGSQGSVRVEGPPVHPCVKGVHCLGRPGMALPFKMWLPPPLSAPQVSGSLAGFQEVLLKALPALSKGMRSRHSPLLGGEHLTWRSGRSIETDVLCCGCGAAAPKALQSCAASAPGRAWPRHVDLPGPCLGLQNWGGCDVPLDLQTGLCEGQQNQKCLWEVHLSRAWVNEPWLHLSPGNKCLVLLFDRIQLGLHLGLGNRKTYKSKC